MRTDLIGPGVRLLFVGVNPSPHAAATGAPFGRPGNRFYPALFRAGITDRLIDASAGLAPADAEHLDARGIGITALVARPTARADQLVPDELVAGVASLAERVRRIRPAVVAFLGITAYRLAFDRPGAAVGRQPDDLANARLWVVPNPSGRNAHAPLPILAAAYREVALAAGVPADPARS